MNDDELRAAAEAIRGRFKDAEARDAELSPGEVPIRDIAEWLLGNGYAEEHPGFGHVTAEELSEALHKEFLIYRAYRRED